MGLPPLNILRGEFKLTTWVIRFERISAKPKGVLQIVLQRCEICLEICGETYRTSVKNRALVCTVIGKTTAPLATDVENSNTVPWISYWKSLDDLHRLARGDSHLNGWDWYVKRNPSHIGLMHETYVVPAGNWETIYLNFTPFGLGQAKKPFEGSESRIGAKVPYASGSMEAKGPTWESMKTRMKKLAKEKQPY